MLSAYRKLAIVALAGLALFALGCSSNNKGKIEGRWKVTALPEKMKGDKDALEDMKKAGVYMYMEFTPDGRVTIGFDGNKDFLEQIKAQEGQTSWDAKYKLLPGDNVEFYDLPKNAGTGAGLFGSTSDRAKAIITINGNEMKWTDQDGTATLTKIP